MKDLTVHAAILAHSLSINENKGLRLRDIIDWILVQTIPGRFEAVCVIVWNGVEREFVQMVRLVDPDGKVVGRFKETVPEARIQEGAWSQVVMGTPLEFQITKPGAYALEIYANDELMCSRPYAVYQRGQMLKNREKYRVAGEVQLGSVLFGTDVDLTSAWHIDNLLVNGGHYIFNPLAQLYIWDYVTTPFLALLECFNSERSIVFTKVYEIRPPSNQRSTTYFHSRVSLGELEGMTSGVNYLRVSWNDQEIEYPFLVFAE